MADESNTEIIETTTPMETVPPKKRPGPQAKNVASGARAETPLTDGAKATGRRRETNASVRAVAKTKAKNVANVAAKKRVTKQEPPAQVLDDIADLLQLEQENARLRKALVEKLRAENADLRKRLGLA